MAARRSIGVTALYPFRSAKWNRMACRRKLYRPRNRSRRAAAVLARALHPLSLKEGLP